MTAEFKTIALIGKYKSPEIGEPLLRLAAYLESRGVRVLLDPITAAHVARNDLEVMPLERAGELADLAIVIGGDGTMLNIARTLAPFDVALVGVNQGRLGFLTDISLETMLDTIGAMLDGKYITESRMLLASEVWRGDQRICSTCCAFNDTSIAKGADGGLDRAGGAHRRPVRLQPARRRPDRGHPHRLDRVRAVGRRADPAPGAVGVRHRPGVPAHAVEPADHDFRAMRRSRSSCTAARMRACTSTAIPTASCGRAIASSCGASRARSACCIRDGHRLLAHAAGEAALERGASLGSCCAR